MRRRGVAVGLALLVCVGACSGDEPPAPQPSASSPAPTGEASTSATPTLTPPPLPPEATTPDAAGAAAFARHWFEVVEWSYASGDTALLTELSDPDCASCQAIASEINDQVRQGGSFRGGQITVRAAVVAPGQKADALVVNASYDQEELTALGAGGEEEAAPAVSAEPVDVYLSARNGAWTVLGMTAGKQ